MDRDDYELVPENAEEYGKQVLRRIGADDEIIDTIDIAWAKSSTSSSLFASSSFSSEAGSVR